VNIEEASKRAMRTAEVAPVVRNAHYDIYLVEDALIVSFLENRTIAGVRR
jgi:hypothetical protein